MLISYILLILASGSIGSGIAWAFPRGHKMPPAKYLAQKPLFPNACGNTAHGTTIRCNLPKGHPGMHFVLVGDGACEYVWDDEFTRVATHWGRIQRGE